MTNERVAILAHNLRRLAVATEYGERTIDETDRGEIETMHRAADEIERLQRELTAYKAALGEHHLALPDEPDCSVPDCITTQIPVHADPTGQTREPPHCPTCDCGSERPQCQHDLTKPDTTLIVIGPYDARCPVCNCEWHIPNPTHVSRSADEA